jgi:glycosyltransferase involved in cell wall biosynthesis
VILSSNPDSIGIRPDIIHVHHAFTPLTFRVIKRARREGIPVVITNHSIAPFHDVYIWRFLKLGFRYLRDASAVIAVSSSAKRFISNFVSSNVTVIPNGVDTEKFRPMKEERENKTLLYVGRFSARKGVQLLAPLLSRYLKKPDIELIIAGSDEMLMLPLLKLQGAVFRNVRVLGFVPEDLLPGLYSYADLFLMPSLTMESFGITAIESLSCATPVIATNVGALPEIIDGCGAITNLLDFPRVIEELLSNPERIRELGFSGRKRMVEEYSWEAVAMRIEDVYFSVLDGEEYAKHYRRY